MDVSKSQSHCKHCRKESKTEAYRCIPCDKLYHPSCLKLHKVYNTLNELIPCKGKSEILIIKSRNVTSGDTAGNHSLERKSSRDTSDGQKGDDINNNVGALFDLLTEVKDKIIGKEEIKDIITKSIVVEMMKV